VRATCPAHTTVPSFVNQACGEQGKLGGTSVCNIRHSNVAFYVSASCVFLSTWSETALDLSIGTYVYDT
jgi:hypothetical protein